MPGQFNLSYRPTSYWGADDSPRSRIHQIKGQDRKETAMTVVASDHPEEIADPEFDQNLPDADREFRGRIHPTLMGGEYLPDFEGKEVEIARVSLASTTGDVISIRAKFSEGRIHYGVVDEYETRFHCEPTESAEPLTMGELIDLIDSTTGEGTYPDYGMGLTSVYRDFNADAGGDPESLVDFVTVSSEFYPDLRLYYAEEAQEWLDQRRTADENGDEGEDGDEDDDGDDPGPRVAGRQSSPTKGADACREHS